MNRCIIHNLLKSCSAVSVTSRTMTSAITLRGIVFILCFLACFSGFISPPLALTFGILFGLFLSNPLPMESSHVSRWLLQASVVALGFAMGKLLNDRGNSSYLIAAGTAICGGSAIAAIAPILHADEEEMALSLGTVFVLNSVASLAFPPLGHVLNLSQTQFGLWAALAIHDTSSVVGAASRYGSQALIIGTTVKLARALWIVPVALGTAAVKRSKAKIHFPWFILLFCLAAVVNTYFLAISPFSRSLFQLGRLGLTATIFLIGSGISRATLRHVGWRPLAQGILLWIVVGLSSLYFIRTGWIAL